MLSRQLQFIKSGIFVAALLPLARLVLLGFSYELGADPVKFVIHSTGTWALVGLLATLSITPLRRVTGIAWLAALRRMLGLFAFFYALLHFASYVWLDQWFDWEEIYRDVGKHPRILVGFAALVLMLPLALTSTNAMMRRLKQRWKTLHRLVYVVAILAVLHFLLLVKKDISEPLVYSAVLAVLLGLRLVLRR